MTIAIRDAGYVRFSAPELDKVFDYWSDRWGHVVEHWTDGDKLGFSKGSHITSVDTMIGRHWGPAAPDAMLS